MSLDIKQKPKAICSSVFIAFPLPTDTLSPPKTQNSEKKRYPTSIINIPISLRKIQNNPDLFILKSKPIYKALVPYIYLSFLINQFLARGG